MFTGIIEEKGTVTEVKKGAVSSRITFRADIIMEDIHLGDSIAVNGVCLTAAALSENTFTADVMAETLRKSNLGNLSPGDHVNLERAMLMGGRLGGHIVSGHTDGTGKIKSMKREENAVWVTVEPQKELMRYIIKKGSAALDGISLTVASADDASFSVSVIPHTGSETTLLEKKPGDIVNIECDVIGKYVEKMLGISNSETKKKSGLDMEMLLKNGFV